MTALYSAGRGLVAVGLLTLGAALGAVTVAAHLLPVGAAAVVAFAVVGATVAALVGWVYVGLVLASGGATGLAGRSRWARAACVGLGVGQIAALLAETVVSLSAGPEVSAAVGTVLDVVLALVTAAAALAIGRAGALAGFTRWALGLVAATQLLTAALEIGRSPALPWSSAVIADVVVPAALVVTGVAYLRAARSNGDARRFVTRAGRTAAQWVVDAPLPETVQRWRSFVVGQHRFTAVRIDEQDTSAEAEVAARPNWATWGGRILLRFRAADDGGTTVDARWSPSLVTTVLTWDQGRRDLEALEAGMTPLEPLPRDVPVP